MIIELQMQMSQTVGHQNFDVHCGGWLNWCIRILHRMLCASVVGWVYDMFDMHCYCVVIEMYSE